MSVPSDLCDYPEDISSVIDETVEVEPALEAYTEEIYMRIRGFYKPRNQRLLRYLLGINKKGGRLTPFEASIAMGCSYQYVKKFIKHVCEKMMKLAGDGTVNFDPLIEDASGLITVNLINSQYAQKVPKKNRAKTPKRRSRRKLPA